MRQQPIRYSSFWAGNMEISNDKKIDTITLVSYQRAIANFVRIVTNKNIPVKFQPRGGDSYTNGQRIVISADLREKNFDPAVGLALHEGSHIAFTDFKSLDTIRDIIQEKGFAKYSQEAYVLKDLLNVVEDRRIDNIIYNSAPGYRGYYLSMYAEYFQNRVIDKALHSKQKCIPTWENYMFHIINFANANRNLRALPELQLIWDVMDIHNIGRLQSTSDAIKVAVEIFDIIARNVTSNKNEPKSSNSDPNTKSDNDTNSEDIKDKSINNTDSNNSKDKEEKVNGHNESEEEEEGNDFGNSGEEDVNESEEEDLEELNPQELRKLEKIIHEQEQFLRGQVDKKQLSKQEYKQAEGLADSNVDLKDVSYNESGSNIRKTKVITIKGINNTIIESGLIDSFYVTWHNDHYAEPEAVIAGMQLGAMLGRKLKTRDEIHALTSTRQKSGKIDKRLIHELGSDVTNIFTKTNIETVQPIYIHLSIDASGSMSGNAFNSAIKTAVAIAKAASMTTSMHVVISLRGEVRSSGYSHACTWQIYDSKIHNMNYIHTHFPKLHAGSNTPEGLCFNSIESDIIKSAKGCKSFFINFSDGMPQFTDGNVYYRGQAALDHTKLHVDRLRKHMQIVSYFISNSESSFDKFQYMYGKDAERIDVHSLAELSKSLNRKFQYGN